MATQQFRMVRRPAGVVSRYEVVVVDERGIPHYALSSFYLEIQRYFADGTAETYLHALLPYFTYLVTDEWRLHRQDRWDSEPAAVRQSVRDYLVERLYCKVLPQDNYQLISLTHKSPSA